MNSTTRCYRFKLIKTVERKWELHMAPIRNLKRESLCTRNILWNILSHSFFQSQPQTPAVCWQRKDRKEFSISHTHVHTWGWRSAHISHNCEWNLPLRIHTCNASICSHKPGQNSISNEIKNDVSKFSIQFRIFPKTTNRNQATLTCFTPVSVLFRYSSLAL